VQNKLTQNGSYRFSAVDKHFDVMDKHFEKIEKQMEQDRHDWSFFFNEQESFLTK